MEPKTLAEFQDKFLKQIVELKTLVEHFILMNDEARAEEYAKRVKAQNQTIYNEI